MDKAKGDVDSRLLAEPRRQKLLFFHDQKEDKMGAKEFFTAIDMLDTYNKIMNITEQTAPAVALHIDTRELGKYRSYVYREKLLKKEILQLTAGRLRTEKLMRDMGVCADIDVGGEYRRGRSKLIDLWLELSKVSSKRRCLEQQLDSITSPFVKNVVRHRYFSDSSKRLVSWAQTAREMGIPMTGVQLREEITAALH